MERSVETETCSCGSEDVADAGTWKLAVCKDFTCSTVATTEVVVVIVISGCL